MESRIESIYYFNYTKDIGYYDSFRNFQAVEIKYLGMALSTPKIRVNASPTEYIISSSGSNIIKSHVATYLPLLNEVSKETAVNFPEYIMICYEDEEKRYFENDPKFCEIFKSSKQHKVEGKRSVEEYASPYALRKEPGIGGSTVQKSDSSATIPNRAQLNSATSKTQTKVVMVQKRNSKQTLPIIVLSILVVVLATALIIISTNENDRKHRGDQTPAQNTTQQITPGVQNTLTTPASPQPYYKELGLTANEYKIAKIVAYNVDEYCEHMAELQEMVAKATYSDDLKQEKVAEYLNNQEYLDYGERIILYRSIFLYDTEYCNDIVDYLNERDDVTYDEIVFVLEELGFAVFEDGTVKW